MMKSNSNPIRLYQKIETMIMKHSIRKISLWKSNQKSNEVEKSMRAGYQR